MLNIKLTAETHARLAVAAERDHRSKQAQMAYYVERGLDQDERAQKKERTTSGTQEH
jgi:hypothetical protein